MIGATGRNSGKSTLACRLIERHTRTADVVGVKVTTIRERGIGECPRGGEGCGACSSLEGDWAITEELGQHPDKDTGRMRTAGARRVYWLRVCQEHLEDGFRALLETVGPDAPVICEATGARQVVLPGLFLMALDPGTDDIKPSAVGVRHLADREVLFDGTEFDLPLETVQWHNGRWTLRRAATAIIMAGGRSTRMGVDKALLAVNGVPLISRIVDQLRPHFAEILISANDPEKLAFLRLPVVVDREPDQGPLMGISSALAAAQHELCFVTACDIPELDLDLVAELFRHAKDHDAVVPRQDEQKFFEPLFALYRKRFADAADAVLASGRRKIWLAYERCRVAYVDLDAGSAPFNINTPEDLERYTAGKDRHDFGRSQ